MKCQGVMEYMQRFLDHDLSEREHEEMRHHMEQCTSCAEMFERLSRLSDELVQLPKVVPPVSIVDSIMPKLDAIDRQARLAAEDAVQSPSIWEKLRSFASLRTFGSIAAAGLLLVIAIIQGPRWFQYMEGSITKNEAQLDSAAAGASSVNTGLTVHSASATSAGRAGSESSAEFSAPLASSNAQAVEEQTDDEKTNRKSALTQKDAVDDDGAVLNPPLLKVHDQMGITAYELHEPDNTQQDTTEIWLTADFSEPTGIPSPGGHYYALVEVSEEGLQMIILNEERERIYASPLKQAEYVSEIAWSEDGESLDYAVYLSEEETWFTIDVPKRMEVQK